MKRILAVLALFTVAALAFTPPASAAVPVNIPLKWRTSALNVAGYVDSSTAAVNQIGLTLATVDTTAWFSTADFDWQAMVTGHGATAQGAFRIGFLGNNVSCDTLFVAVEASGDGITPCSNTTFVGLVGVSGEDYLSGIVTMSSTTQGTVGAGTVWMQPYLRLRVRCDGSNSAQWLNCKARIQYLKRGQ